VDILFEQFCFMVAAWPTPVLGAHSNCRRY